ncbi:MAG: flavodoxin [Clostridiales bacterium]|nr:flavodoxin [Clostridiales bacterium]
MKRIVPFLLSLFMLLTSAGCGQNDNSVDENEITSQEAAPQVTAEALPESESGTTISTDTEGAGNEDSSENRNMLIAYFSWSGNTGQVAQEIQRQTGADLFELVLTEPYPEDYEAVGDRWHEEQAADARPELAVEIENMEDYDIIFLGYPIWSGTLPSPNRSFLDQYDFSGKTIIPFCTHGGSRFGSSISVIEDLAGGATILDGYETSGNSAGDCEEGVTEWLQKLGFIQDDQK